MELAKGGKMKKYNLYWGDFHTHFENPAIGDSLLEDAKENIDFCAVLCYPFFWERKLGLLIETVKQRKEFLNIWKELQELSRQHNQPGKFTTFLGYEWHGNRTYYGDHNVIYFDEDNPLDDTWDLPELYANMKKRKALVIPHHTGYSLHHRGKNWDFFDNELSPVMEIFSIHGSSEGCNTPYPMENNRSMGPRTSGGTFQDALARGYLIGVIGSNDGQGLPGRWGKGRAGVWAEDCTREAIWDALCKRRTYAVTGDRIILDFEIEGAPMGSVTKAGSFVDVSVSVIGSNAIDRIELLKNGNVVDTYCHSGKWEKDADKCERVKVLVEVGWGPSSKYGFFEDTGSQEWKCKLRVKKGKIENIERCFSLPGQKVNKCQSNYCEWILKTMGRDSGDWKQSVIFEIKGNVKTEMLFNIEGEKINTTVRELLNKSILLPLLKESKERIRRMFGLSEEIVGNPDIFYHNARKIKIHQAIPESGYKVKHTFKKVRLNKGRNYFYVRVSQLNGQLAWSSPIWVDSI